MQTRMLLAFLIWEWPTIACTVQNSFPNVFHLLEGCHLPCISLQLLSHLLLEAVLLPLDKTWGLEIDDTVPPSNQNLFPIPREPELLCLEAQLDCYHSTVQAWSCKRFNLSSLVQKLRRGIRYLLEANCFSTRTPESLHQEHCNSVLYTISQP